MVKKSAFSVENPEDSLGFLLWRNTTIWQRRIKSALLPHDITHAQFVIMAAVRFFAETKQEPTQITIAHLTGLDKMTISKSLKKLVTMGLISRAEDARDTRAKTVKLTAKGNKLVEILVAIVDGVDQQFFGVMAAKEQKALGQLFNVLNAKNDL
jgi:DNA-binding MarR family transcriptional regulator